jgi:hypothetical protein
LAWFSVLHANWFLGLRALGFANILNTILTVPVYLAVYGAFRRTSRQAFLALTVVVFCIGGSVYIANNPSLAMLDLSHQYASASGPQQKLSLLSAGQALLAQGEDFTPGSFLGFFLVEVAGLMMASILFMEKSFGRITSGFGLAGYILLLIFTVWATFIPAYYDEAMMIAALGGIFSIVYYILLSRGLFKLAR